jgi:hypothetical protein
MPTGTIPDSYKDAEKFVASQQEILADLMTALIDKRITAEEWLTRMKEVLAVGHTTAALLGLASEEIPPDVERELEAIVARQEEYLDGFYADIVGVPSLIVLMAELLRRVRMYAGSMNGTYWYAAYNRLRLPALPGDGTSICMTNCKCLWRIHLYSEGNADCYWELGEADHCYTCKTRAEEWSPYRIRYGVGGLP